MYEISGENMVMRLRHPSFIDKNASALTDKFT
jgi:hypothetical protein